MQSILGILGFMTLAVLAIIFVPLGIIWSLNTLFPVLVIGYSLQTWAAVVILNLTWMYKGVKQ